VCVNYPIYIDCTVDQCSNCPDKDTCNRTSCKNNIFVNLSKIESSIVEHMELSLFKSTSDNRTLKKTVLIFPGYEYEISYFDFDTNQSMKVKGIVDAISGTAGNMSTHTITITYKNQPPKPPFKTDCDKEITQGLPNCGCILSKPDGAKYFNETTTVDISVANITDINYIKSGIGPKPPAPPRKMVKVVLLGISAEIVRAVVINLKMLEDDCKDAVRDVCMKTGGVYTVTYFSAKDRAIYEFNGKLIGIKETDQVPDSANCIVRKTERVGMTDSIYNECEVCNSSDVDNYLEGCCIKKDVLLTFDTSIDFSGEYESIMLSWIRDCKVISEEPEITPPTPDDPDSDDKPNCDCCCGKEIKMNVGGNQLTIDPAKQSVELKTDTSTESYTLQEIMDFYFGS